MGWQDVAPLLKDSSARPFIPYNFLRDLDPKALERLDGILEHHLEMDANNVNGAKHGAPVTCRICGKACENGHYRGQHERAHREGRI
jgi:hypothetical protein